MNNCIVMNGKYIISILSLMYLGEGLEAQTNIVSKKIETVVIDAGHGGKDPGAIGKNSKEKDVTLGIALKTGAYIKAQNPGVKVIYTRDEDRFVELHERANIANKAKADLFISIHANSNAKKEVNGSEFWVLGLHKADENLEVAKKENAAVNLEYDVEGNYGFDPNSPEGNIIMTMKQSLYLDKSILFAKSIEKNYSFESNQINRGTKQAGFLVLYKTAMPSVLVEVGFISNQEEETFINSTEGQAEIAMKIAGAFADYKLKYESASGSPESITANKPAVKEVAKKAPKPYLQSGDTHSDENLKSEDASENPSFPSKPQQAKRTLIKIEDDKPEVSEPDPKLETKAIETPSATIASATIAKEIPSPASLAVEPIAAKEIVASKPEALVPPTQTMEPTSASLMNKVNKRIVILDEDDRDLSQIESKPKKTEAVEKPMEIKEVQKAASTPAKEPIKAAKLVYEANENLPSFKKDQKVQNDILENAKILEAKEPAQKTEKPVKAALYTAPLASKLTSSADAMVYRVQVKAAGKKINASDPIFNLSLNVVESFEGGLYKYLIGEYASLEAAKKKQSELKSAGVTDAFVVKYQNGVRVK